MRSVLLIVTIVMGAGFTLQGVGWLVAPDRAAASLGMPLLDGLARSTQIGDFAAFFLTLGLSILTPIGLGRARLLYFPAGLLGERRAVPHRRVGGSRSRLRHDLHLGGDRRESPAARHSPASGEVMRNSNAGAKLDASRRPSLTAYIN